MKPAPALKLGLVTWNVASTWDFDALLGACSKAGIEGVEPRTTHPHGIEPDLSPQRRREVRRRFADAGVAIWGLGSTCEFHSTDPAEVARQIVICADFVRLAADLGAKGVKVRPNGIPKGGKVRDTLVQIGQALAECGRDAADHGIEIWLEVHGDRTSLPRNIHAIMKACGHPSVGVCWNSNRTDMAADGTVTENLRLLKPWLKSCHITDLESDYPWAELFGLLKAAKYDRFTLCEYHKSMDPASGAEFLAGYRRRWLELQGKRA